MFFFTIFCFFFFFKQKTAYEMRISDWSSDVCSSDLLQIHIVVLRDTQEMGAASPLCDLRSRNERLQASRQGLRQGRSQGREHYSQGPAQQAAKIYADRCAQ